MRANSLYLHPSETKPLAVVLGTNEIASAVAVKLKQRQFRVVLSHDAYPPVIRRSMAFQGALFGDICELEGIRADRVDSVEDLISVTARSRHVGVTLRTPAELAAMCRPAVLIDARMQKQLVAPDWRVLGMLTVGLGPNFTVGANCDFAIETHPGSEGFLVDAGTTRCADGHASELGGLAAGRFIYSYCEGLWYTPLDIGTRVYRGVMLGLLDGHEVCAPVDGFIRGIARDGTHVPGRVKLVEIDPRGRQACWTGIDQRGRAIADGVVAALTRDQSLPAEHGAALSGMIDWATS
jgi:hypothetical protein